MPIEVSPQTWQWRRLESDTYDNLRAAIARQLRAGPNVRDLSPEEELELGRLCLLKKNHAEVLERYLQLRLGRGADATTLNDIRFAPTVDAAVMFVFKHSEPAYTPEADGYIKRFANGRPLNLPMVKRAFAEYQKQREQQKAAAPPQISEEELRAAPDEDIQQALSAVRRQHGDAERKRRELLHNTARLTPEQAIEALRGPEE